MDEEDVRYIRRVLDEIESNRWYDEGPLRFPKKPARAQWPEDDFDAQDLGHAIAYLFEMVGRELESVVLARLEWAWGFLESAGFSRVELDPTWSAYVGSESVEPSFCLLAATTKPGIETDRLLMAKAFCEGGDSVGMPFVHNAPSGARFHEEFAFDERIGWLVDAVGEEGDCWETIFGKLDDPWGWDGWPPAPPGPEEPHTSLAQSEIDAKREALQASVKGPAGMFYAWGKSIEVEKRLNAWILRRDPTYPEALKTYEAEHAAWKRQVDEDRDLRWPQFRRHLMSRYAREYMGWNDSDDSQSSRT